MDEWWRCRIATTGYYTEHQAGHENAGETKGDWWVDVLRMVCVCE